MEAHCDEDGGTAQAQLVYYIRKYNMVSYFSGIRVTPSLSYLRKRYACKATTLLTNDNQCTVSIRGLPGEKCITVIARKWGDLPSGVKGDPAASMY
jgi:hypothetical protein